MSRINYNTNQLALMKEVEKLKYQLLQYKTLLGVCPFDPEELRGPQGIQGPRGYTGPKGEDFKFEDFTIEQIESLRAPALEAANYSYQVTERVNNKIAEIESAIIAVEQAIEDSNNATISANNQTSLALIATTNTNTAISKAIIAADNANASAVNANTKALLAETAATNANNKADLANTSATNANSSAIQATNAANLANEKAILANDAATNADEKAALAQTAATKANTAASNAMAKIAETETARQNAITATTNANTATTNANNAANTIQTALDGKLDKGAYTGNAFDLKSLIDTKADLVGGKIPASQLPAYVDDVLKYANLASFPATGENSKIYIAIDTNITYRWTGTGYAEISASLALGETSSTAYRGDKGKIAYDHSQTIGNPHGTTKADIGLGNVENTKDADKPISTATQTALNLKIDKGSLTSNDDSLLVEGENIEVKLSIYSEEFEQKTFNLAFTPINILGVYKNGIYLRSSEFVLNLPKSITINDYNTNDIVIVQYQHLKTDI